MKQSVFEIQSNAALADGVYKMLLCGDTSEITVPGQFVNIKLAGNFLRRPLSVCDCEGDSLTVIYKTVGRGTKQLAEMQAGERLDILTGLGNGFDLSCSGKAPLLIGGGAGVSPMYMLAKALREQGKEVSVILGFNTKSEVFFEDEFKKLGCTVAVTTADGSYGTRGFVTAAIAQGYSHFYACGPEPMLKAVCDATDTSGQLSFEARMGCGFGACMGCSCQTITGSKRICREGPVMRKEELLWK